MRASNVSVSRSIAVAPKRVYEILSDYRTHHPKILPTPEFESLVVEEGGIGAGTRIRVVMRVMGTRTELHMRIEEPSPGNVLRETDALSGAVTTFTVTPSGEGSLVEIATTWPGGPGLKRWVDAKLGPRMARSLYARELEQLESYARTLS